MYAFKKFVGALTTPMSLALMLCVIALVFWWRKRPRAAARFAATAAMLLYLFSISATANLLLGSLERQYAPMSDPAPIAPRYIVVLGSGYAPRDDLPVTAVLDPHGLARVVEGVRLWRLQPDAELVLSGGSPGANPKPARGYELLARGLGVDAAHIRVLDRPLDTSQESREIAAVVGTRNFLLVTSAGHMPRAMLLMRRQGLNAHAAPTSHGVDGSRAFGLGSLVPGSGALRNSEFALHEYLGLAALAIGVQD